VTAQAIMGILDSPPAFITGGEVRYCGQDILKLSDEERRRVRGPEISMVFQDALSALNPVFPVGWQIGEMFRKHRGMNRSDSQAEAVRLMERVQIPGAAQRVKAYPHQFSGGMRQRVAIAMSLALEPSLIVADEPVTALDVIVQRQILDVFRSLRDRLGISVVLVTHDISVVAYACDRVAVMYAGKVVEEGSVQEVLKTPAHPYTMGLSNAFPDLTGEMSDLIPIEGDPPDLRAPPPGCRFVPRCPFALAACSVGVDPVTLGPGRIVACLRHDESAILRERAREDATWKPR
jgi:oligopeptide transport system ATP-binding protein